MLFRLVQLKIQYLFPIKEETEKATERLSSRRPRQKLDCSYTVVTCENDSDLDFELMTNQPTRQINTFQSSKHTYF